MLYNEGLRLNVSRRPSEQNADSYQASAGFLRIGHRGPLLHLHTQEVT